VNGIRSSIVTISITHKKLWWTKRDNEKKRLLSADWKMSFKQKAILCVDYKGLTPEQEREIFQVCPIPLSEGKIAQDIRSESNWESHSPQTNV